MRRPFLITLAAVAAVILVSYGLFVFLKGPSLDPRVLYGNGSIEGTDVKVGSEVAGRVIESNVIEGREVQQGEVLVRIDETDFELKRRQVEAEREALSNALPQIQAELEAARHHAATAEDDLKRYRSLRSSGTASAQKEEQAENAAAAAASKVVALEAKLRETTSQEQAAEQAVGLAASQIEKSIIRAPKKGVITVKGVEPGEVVAPGQTLAILVDMSRLELRVFIAEKDLAKIKVGAAARVRVDSFPQRHFDARVSRIEQEAQFTPREVHMPDERSRMVFGVVLSLSNPDGALKPGMPADAWILWDGAKGWPESLIVP